MSPGSLYHYWALLRTLILWSHNTEPLILAPLTHQEMPSISLVSDNHFPRPHRWTTPRPKRQSYIPPSLSQCIVKLLFTTWLVHHRQNARSSSNAIRWCIMTFDMIIGRCLGYRPAVLLGGRQWYVHMWRKFDSIIRLPESSLGVGKGNGGINFGFIWERKRGRRCVAGRNITLECFQMKEFVHTQHT